MQPGIVQHRRGAWHACCQPQAVHRQIGGFLVAGTRNQRGSWKLKPNKQNTEGELSSHTQALLPSQPTYKGCPLCFVLSPRLIDPSINIANLVRLPYVLNPALYPQLSPAETRRRLSLLHTCISLCVLLTALVTRTLATSEAGMAWWSPGGQSLAQLRDPKWAMTIVSKEIAAWVGSGCWNELIWEWSVLWVPVSN